MFKSLLIKFNRSKTGIKCMLNEHVFLYFFMGLLSSCKFQKVNAFLKSIYHVSK